MSYPIELRAEAFDLYLKGFNAAQIHAELHRRHAGLKLPSIKTIGEKWPYIPDAAGKTWSERRYEAEAAARDAVTKDYVSARAKMLQGVVSLQSKLQERVARAIDNAADADPENLTQEVYALLNATRFAARELHDTLAEEARQKDAIDLLIESVCRVVPDFETKFKPAVLEEFRRLAAAKKQSS